MKQMMLLMNFLNLFYKHIKKQKKNREKEEANLLMKCWFIVL